MRESRAGANRDERSTARHLGSWAVLSGLAICLLAASACRQTEPAGTGWSPSRVDSDTGEGASTTGDTGTDANSLPPRVDAGRVDGGDVGCEPRPICNDRGCRLDLELPRTEKLHIRTGPDVTESDLADGELRFATASRNDDHRSAIYGSERNVELTTDSTQTVELPGGSYNVMWVTFTEQSGHLGVRRVVREKYDVSDESVLTVTSDDVRMATLSGDLLLRGRPLEHWARKDDYEVLDHRDIHTKWELELVPREMDTHFPASFEGDASTYEIAVPPGTYDVYIDPKGNYRDPEGMRTYDLSAQDVRGAVKGERRVAKGVRVEGDTELDIDLRPVKLEVDLSTNNFDQYSGSWALHFVGPDGQLFTQPTKLDADGFETWMYPGNYSVWLSHQDADRQGSGVHGTPLEETLLVARDVPVKAGEELSADAELVEWSLEMEVDGEPIHEWAQERPDYRHEGNFNFVLRGLEQPETPHLARPSAPHADLEGPNLWPATDYSDIARRATWVPPGRYEVLVEVDEMGLHRQEVVHIRNGDTKTVDLQIDPVRVNFELNGNPVRELSGRWRTYVNRPGSSYGERSRWHPLTGLSWLKFESGDRPYYRGWLYRGSYEFRGFFSGYQSYAVRNSLRQAEGLPVFRDFRRGPWHTSQETLTVDLKRHRLAGRIGRRWRTRIDPANGHDRDDEWQLEFVSRRGGPDRNRRFWESRVEGQSPSTYQTWVPPGTYDVFVSNGDTGGGVHNAYHPVARCVRVSRP